MMPGRLDSDQLRIFLAVAEAGSMSGGAERVLRSQSAVSLQVKQLEAAIDARLFHRHGRGVALTPAGERLLPYAQGVVSTLDEALAAFGSREISGTLRVGIPDDHGTSLLPGILGAFARRYPTVELQVQCAFSTGFRDALKRGELDIAVFDTERPESGELVLRPQRAVWVSSAGHAVHRRDPVPLSLFDRDCWWRDAAVNALRDAGREFRVAFSSESNAGVAAAIEAGIGVGLLAEEVLTPAMRVLSPGEGFPEIPRTALVLATRKGVAPVLAETLADAIRQQTDRPSQAG